MWNMEHVFDKEIYSVFYFWLRKFEGMGLEKIFMWNFVYWSEIFSQHHLDISAYKEKHFNEYLIIWITSHILVPVLEHCE